MVLNVVLTFVGLILIYFIVLGYVQNGKYPVYGDDEAISFDGLDRDILIFSIISFIYGTLTWLLYTIVVIISRKALPTYSILFGGIAIIIDTLLFFSQATEWMLD